MSQSLLPNIQFKVWTNDGSNIPLVGGKVYFFETGTLTFAPTYQTEGGSENTNPVILDINGEAQIWLSPNIIYDVYVCTAESAFMDLSSPVLTRERVSVSASGGTVGGDFIKKVTPTGTVQSVNTDIKTSKVTGLITKSALFEMRDGVMTITNSIQAPSNNLTVELPNSAKVVLDNNITTVLESTVNAQNTGINAPIVTITDKITAKTDIAEFNKKYNPLNDTFIVYDSVNGEADRYARLSDVTGVIEGIADTATIDLNIDGSKVLTADVKDNSITLSKLDTTSVDTRYALNSALGNYVLKSGDIMSGPLSIVRNTGGVQLTVDSGTQDIAYIRSKGTSNTTGWSFGSGSSGWFAIRNEDSGTTTFQISRTTNNATFTNRVTAGALSSNGDLSVGTTSVFNGNNTHNTTSDTRSTYQVNGVGTGLIQAVANDFRIAALAGSDLDFYTNGSSRGFISNSNNQWNFLTQINGTGGVFSSSLTASSFIRSGGLSSQFLKADGSVDSNTYFVNSVSGHSVLARTTGSTGTLSEVLLNTNQLLGRLSGNVGAINMVDLPISTATQTALNGKQDLNSNLTELSALSGTSGLIRRTGSTYVYDNAAYITASALADYVLKAGDTMTGNLNISNNTGGSMLFLNSGTANAVALRLKGNSTTSGWRFGIRDNTTGDLYISNDDTTTLPLTISKSTNNATFTNRVTAGALSSNGDLSVGTTSVFNGNNTHNSASDIRSIYQVSGVNTGQLQAIANDFRIVSLGTNTNLSFFSNGATRGRLDGTTNQWTFNTAINAESQINQTNTATTGQPIFQTLNNSVSDALSIRYTETAVGSIGADQWQYRLGGTSFRPLVFTNYDTTELFKIGLTDLTAGVNLNGTTASFTGTGGTISIGNVVSYVNMPTTDWSLRLGTSSSGAVDDGASARWTQRVSGTNSSGYVLRWLSESRSGASMGAEVERMSLSNSGLTIIPSGSLPLTLNTTGTNIGCQIKFDNDSTTSGWRTGIASDATGDFILVNEDLGNVPFRIAKSSNNLTLLGSIYAANTPTGTVVSGGYLGLNASNQIVKTTAPNPFNQSLNTTNDATFNNLTLSGSATIGGATITGALSANSGTFGGDVILQASGVTRGAIGLNSGNTVIKSYNGSGTLIDNPITISNSTGGLITSTRPLQINDYAKINTSLTLGDGTSSLSGDFTQFKPAGAISNYQIRGIYSGASSGGVLEVIANNASDNLTSYGIRSGASAFGSPELYTWDITTNNVYFPAKVSLARSTAASAGFNIDAFGVTVTSPVDGDIWKSAADSLAVRMGTNTRTVTFNEKSQTFSGTQTFNIITATNTITGRQLAQTRQTSATSTGAITWTLTSGGTMDLTTALTGAVTMNITAPSAGGWSTLYLTQGATLQTVTLSLTGVSWILTGANGLTGTNTITIPTATMVANKSFVIQLYWSTTTRCYVTVT